MNAGDDSIDPEEVQDAIYRVKPGDDGPELGSAIGSQFDPPGEPGATPPPPPPASSAPASPTPPSPPPIPSAPGNPVPPTPPTSMPTTPAGPSDGQPPAAPTPGGWDQPTAPIVQPPTPNPAWGQPTTPATAPPGGTWEQPGAGATQPAPTTAFGAVGANAPAVGTPNYAGDGFATPEKKSSKLPWIFAVVAAVVLLGGGAFFALTAFGASGGSASPEEGIDQMLVALGEEDFVTMAELLEPSERRTLAEPALTELLPEMVRLGVFDDSVDAGDFEGLDLVFTDVEYRVERPEGADDIAHVFLTDGEVATNINSATLPFTDLFDTDDFDTNDRTQIEEDPDDTPAVFVERDGRWYFSMWFTVAEAARLDAGEDLPSPAESPAAIPSDTPEAAVEGLLTAFSDLDMEAMIGHTDPEEMAVLYRYAPLFIDEAQAALDELGGDLSGDGIEWEFSNFDFDVEQDGDDAVVTIRGFTFDFVNADGEVSVTYSRDQISGDFDVEELDIEIGFSPTSQTVSGTVDGAAVDVEVQLDPATGLVTGTGDLDGEMLDFSLQFDESGSCSEFAITASDGSDESGCLEEEGAPDDIGELALRVLEDWPTEFPGIPMVARQTDGGWYVSPIGSVFGGVLTGLEELEEGDFEDFGDTFADLADDAADDAIDAIGGGSIGGAIDDDDIIGSFEDPVEEDASFITVADGSIEEFVGGVSTNTFDSFLIDLEAGSVVVVIAEGAIGELDTTLRVVDPNGDQIGFNDDADPAANLENGLGSLLVIDALVDGQYRIEVAGFGTSSGDYSLIVDRVSDGVFDDVVDVPAPADPVDNQFEDQIALATGPNETEIVEGRLDDAQLVDSYSIELDAGEVLTVSVASTDVTGFDPILSVFDATDAELARDDDGGSIVGLGPRDSFLEFTAPATDVFFLDISAFGAANGDYVLTVSRGDGSGGTVESEPAPNPPPAAGETELAVADGATASLDAVIDNAVADEVGFSLDLAAGDTVNIIVEATGDGALDPRASLRFGGAEIAVNDDAADGTAVNDSRDSQIIETVAETGTYVVVVDGFASSQGTFTITVQRN